MKESREEVSNEGTVVYCAVKGIPVYSHPPHDSSQRISHRETDDDMYNQPVQSNLTTTSPAPVLAP
jgi:hypothetical protein